MWDNRQPVRTWTRKLRKLRRRKPLPGDSRWRYSRLRRLCTCCSELQNVWISSSTTVTCSYDIKCWINPITSPNPIYEYSNSIIWQYSSPLNTIQEQLTVCYKPRISLLISYSLFNNYKCEQGLHVVTTETFQTQLLNYIELNFEITITPTELATNGNSYHHIHHEQCSVWLSCLFLIPSGGVGLSWLF
jgi:hypothetical protein